MIATTLVDTTVEPEAFRVERLSDPRLHAIAAKVTVTQDANPDVNALWPQHFVIELNDGWTWERTIEYAIGHPKNPLSHDRHIAKFRKCWQWAGLASEQGERLIESLDALDAIEDVRRIATLLVR